MRPLRVLSLATFTLVLAGATSTARAQSFLMTMQGVLDSRSSIVGATTTVLPDASPFTLTAMFNTTTANLVAPIGVPGFVAYTPSAMMLTVGGRTYGVQPFTTATPTGLSVAVFDSTTPFGVPKRYGVGVIQNPLIDGAGIVADFFGASPSFVIGATGIVPTVFTGFAGVGVSSGACTSGTPDNCLSHATTPIPLTSASQSYSLILGNYDADVARNFSFSVTITPVPEPNSVALVAVALVALAFVKRRRQVQP